MAFATCHVLVTVGRLS